MEKEKFYITTSITYASQKPHFGNTYEVIMADCIARYKRQRGYDVFFLTGTDEHGQKIESKAKEAGVTPKEYVDRVSSELRDVWDLMNSSYDKFIRTTDDYHEKSVQAIFKKMYERGDIYKGYYEGWYCTPCEAFFTDTQATDGKCPDCGRPVEKMREEAYFFKMTKYANRLIEYINTHPDFIQPESRKKEMLNNFLLPGLQDLCVSRTSFKWGVPVTFDDKHVVYVWVDALSNYITALGYNPDNETQNELFLKYWPADVHIIGKDIVRFHSIYWPIFLMSLELPLPEKIFGHPWFTFGADKMSKSRGNVIYADELSEDFGVDGVRYYALSEMPYANDGSITYENVIARYNTDLANNLGNLVKRCTAMTVKYFGGSVPSPGAEAAPDGELKDAVRRCISAFVAKMDDYHIADAIADVLTMLSRANKYIDETTPWTLAKNEADSERLGTVIYNLLEAIRISAVLLTPVMPDTCEEILSRLGTDKRDYASISDFGALESGATVRDGSALFTRIDETVFMKALNDKNAANNSAEADTNSSDTKLKRPEGIAQIGIDDFMDVELRSALVTDCEAVPKSKKLLKFQLDLGYEKRQVVSGIAQFYKPEDTIGKKLIVVANLKPAVLCGIESQGMILSSGEDDVRIVFLDDATPLGERIH